MKKNILAFNILMIVGIVTMFFKGQEWGTKLLCAMGYDIGIAQQNAAYAALLGLCVFIIASLCACWEKTRPVEVFQKCRCENRTCIRGPHANSREGWRCNDCYAIYATPYDLERIH